MFPINILLIDDHHLFAKSLSIALEEYKEIEHFYTFQEISSLEDFLAGHRTDLILLDINLGKLARCDGLEIARRLKETHSEIKIVLLTGYDLPVYRHEAKKAGVSGFLNKSISPEDLVASLQKIYHGSTCFPPESQDFFIEDLTDAEKKVLQLLGAGKKRKEAAKELYISERTLSNHLQHIFEKLSVTSTVEAVTKAIRLGYLLPERESIKISSVTATAPGDEGDL